MRLRSFSLFFTAIVFGACGDDSSNSEPETPPTPPSLTVGEVDTVPSSGVSSSDDPPVLQLPSVLPLPCNGAVVVPVTTSNFELKPPGSCGATRLCGHILLRATGPNAAKNVTVRSIAPRVFVTLTPPLSSWTGAVSFEAQLVDDRGVPFEAEGTSTATATFSFQDTCGALSGEAGAGGSSSGGAGEPDAGGAGIGGAGSPSAGAGGATEGGATEGGATLGGAGAGGAVEGGAGGAEDAGSPSGGSGAQAGSEFAGGGGDGGTFGTL